MSYAKFRGSSKTRHTRAHDSFSESISHSYSNSNSHHHPLENLSYIPNELPFQCSSPLLEQSHTTISIINNQLCPSSILPFTDIQVNHIHSHSHTYNQSHHQSLEHDQQRYATTPNFHQNTQIKQYQQRKQKKKKKKIKYNTNNTRYYPSSTRIIRSQTEPSIIDHQSSLYEIYSYSSTASAVSSPSSSSSYSSISYPSPIPSLSSLSGCTPNTPFTIFLPKMSLISLHSSPTPNITVKDTPYPSPTSVPTSVPTPLPPSPFCTVRPMKTNTTHTRVQSQMPLKTKYFKHQKKHKNSSSYFYRSGSPNTQQYQYHMSGQRGKGNMSANKHKRLAEQHQMMAAFHQQKAYSEKNLLKFVKQSKFNTNANVKTPPLTTKSYVFHKSHHSYGNKQKWPVIQQNVVSSYNQRYQNRNQNRMQYNDECMDNYSDHPHIHQHTHISSTSSNNNFTDFISFKSPLSSSTTTLTNTPENNIDMHHSYNNSSSSGSEYYVARPVIDVGHIHDGGSQELRRYSSPNNKISDVSKNGIIQSSSIIYNPKVRFHEMSTSQTSYTYSDYSNSTNNTSPDRQLFSSFSDRNLLRPKNRPSKNRHRHKIINSKVRNTTNLSTDMNIILGNSHSQTYSGGSYHKTHTYNEEYEKYDTFDSFSENNEHNIFTNYHRGGKYMNREQKRKHDRKVDRERKRQRRRVHEYEKQHEKALLIAFQKKQQEIQMFEQKKMSNGKISNHSSKHSRTYTPFVCGTGSSQNQYEITNHRSYKAARKRDRRKHRHKQHGRHGVYCNTLKVHASKHKRLNSSLQKLKNKQKVLHKTKNKKTQKFLRTCLKKESLFHTLQDNTLRRMVGAMCKLDIAPGDCAIRAGEFDDAYFVIEHGQLEKIQMVDYKTTPESGNSPESQLDLKEDEEESVDYSSCVNNNLLGQKTNDTYVGSSCTVSSSHNHNHNEQTEKIVQVLGKGDTFGVSALLYATTHKYTYRVPLNGNKPCRMWALDSDTFTRMRKKLVSTSMTKLSRLVKFMKCVKIFQHFADADLTPVAEAVQRMCYKKNQVILNEGEMSTLFFIIYRGSCAAYKLDNKNKEIILKKYSKSDTFGELGIITQQSRAASIRVTSNELIVYALPAADFRTLLGDNYIQQLMNRTIDEYKEDGNSTLITNTTIGAMNTRVTDGSQCLMSNSIACKLKDLTELGVLGMGGFGRVLLVEDPSTKLTYALKKVRKNHVLQTSQEQHVINERRILSSIDSLFCSKLYNTYQDKLNVYFLLEAVLGGELFSLLRFQKCFPRRTATFYAGNVVLAFEYLHKKNVIYRDLKPENLLVSSNGYLKLVDFGFAKIRNNSCTLCGTPQYLAPEVIQNFPHGFTVDWWSLGILIYEMIFGVVPFENDHTTKMYAKILTHPVIVPEMRPIPSSCKKKIPTRNITINIIKSLLKKQAHKRLGAGIDGSYNVKKNAFFHDLDWNQMENQTFVPPYKPKILSNRDLGMFDKFPDTTPDEELLPDPENTLFQWCKEF